MKRKNPKYILRKDTGSLQLQYSQKGEWFRLNSHIKCDDKDWDENSQVIRGNRKDDNLIIQGNLKRIEGIIYDYRLKHSGKPSIDYIRRNWSVDREGGVQKDKILPLYEEFWKYKKDSVVCDRNYSSLNLRLVPFCESKGYIYLKDITTGFKDELVNFLVRGNLQNQTVRKRIKTLREFIRWCKIKKKLKVNNDIDWKVDLKINKGGINIIILTETEFNRLRDIQCLDGRLDRVRDLYVLGCTTGLRYSDLVRLKPLNVKESGCIEIITQKTSDFCRVPLNEISKSILDKYDNDPPKISNQKLNKYLYELFGDWLMINDIVVINERRGNKVIEVEYKRWEKLSMHSTRKYFITSCISNGITSDSIMKWTTHYNLKIFYDYVQKGRNEEKQMKGIFQL